MAFLRRKRLPDGTFGELEKVFKGETDSERIVRLESENVNLMLALTDVYELLISARTGGSA